VSTAFILRISYKEQKLEQVNSEHERELNRLLTDLAGWKERALKNEGKSQQLANELVEWKDRALKAEGENQRLANKLIEWQDHAVKAGGQTRRFPSNTPLETPSQVTVCLDNLSNAHIQYSYTEAGELIQGFVPPAGRIPILCLLHQQYTFNVTDGVTRGHIRDTINQDNQKLVLSNCLT